MKVCVSYSSTHDQFFKDWFLDSFPFEENVSLLVKKVPQVCKSGNLFSSGWRNQMIEKQFFINECITNCKPSEVVLFSDVDVRFYGDFSNDLEKSLGDKDICFMKDHNSDFTGRCGGFFVMRVSERLKHFFNSVRSRLTSHTDHNVTFETSEQSTINNLLRENSDIDWGYLPPRYYTHGLYTQGIKNFSDDNQSGLWWENKSYEEKSNVYVPSDLLVHHANWCHGVKNKVHLLSFIKDKIDYRKNNHPIRRGG
tara:strand:- start:2 stop:760 length:759 start_codon:yes stop_codon:yes gene_type:complete